MKGCKVYNVIKKKELNTSIHSRNIGKRIFRGNGLMLLKGLQNSC